MRPPQMPRVTEYDRRLFGRWMRRGLVTVLPNQLVQVDPDLLCLTWRHRLAPDRPWTPANDTDLRRCVAEGVRVGTMEGILQRNRAVIEARLAHLGLAPPGPPVPAWLRDKARFRRVVGGSATWSEAARTLGASLHVLRRAAEALGVAPDRAKYRSQVAAALAKDPVRQARAKEIWTLHAAGWTRARIAAHLGLSVSLVRQRILERQRSTRGGHTSALGTHGARQ